MLKGSNVALPTPFRNEEVDEDALRGLVQWNISGGTQGLLVLGSTGEAPTMTDEEHHRVIRVVVQAASKRVPVVAGCGTNSTRRSIQYTEQAKEAGADAALIITPYYNKPTQEGMYRHFKAINDAVDFPIILYNNPGRCIVDLSVDTIARLARLRNVIGLKESNPDLRRVIHLRRSLGRDFLMISGDEPTGVPYLLAGGDCIYSTIGNAIPATMQRVHDLYYEGRHDAAMILHSAVASLVSVMYCEPNPVPLKYMLSVLGMCTPEVRLPLTELAPASQELVRNAMVDCGVVSQQAAIVEPAAGVP